MDNLNQYIEDSTPCVSNKAYHGYRIYIGIIRLGIALRIIIMIPLLYHK